MKKIVKEGGTDFDPEVKDKLSLIYEEIPIRIKADLEEEKEHYLPEELLQLEKQKVDKRYPSRKNKVIREMVSEYQYLVYFGAKLRSEVIELNKFTGLRQPEQEYFKESSTSSSLFNKYLPSHQG